MASENNQASQERPLSHRELKKLVDTSPVPDEHLVYWTKLRSCWVSRTCPGPKKTEFIQRGYKKNIVQRQTGTSPSSRPENYCIAEPDIN